MKSSKTNTITVAAPEPEEGEEKVPFYGKKGYTFVAIYIGIACSLWLAGDYFNVVA